MQHVDRRLTVRTSSNRSSSSGHDPPTHLGVEAISSGRSGSGGARRGIIRQSKIPLTTAILCVGRDRWPFLARRPTSSLPGGWSRVSFKKNAQGVCGCGRMAQLGHRAGLDLTDAFAGEIEIGAHLVEGSRFASVEPEAEPQDLALA